MNELNDKARGVRKGEELNVDLLKDYLKCKGKEFDGEIIIKQFPGGYSNLTYSMTIGDKEFVLRKPPIGANIKSAHDMEREFKVLSLLKPVYSKIPNPILFCDDLSILDSPFYIMERVNGMILRNTIPTSLNMVPDDFKKLSESTLDNLVDMHNLDIEETGLITLGKPKGYVERQVKGWSKRYAKSETDAISGMNIAMDWLNSNMPTKSSVAFLHNDYKYDNLVLDSQSLEIKAVLDWEMSTVGDPLMDLGAMLSYWVESEENPALKQFNLTWAEGNLTRQEVVERYALSRDVNVDDVLFYYVFGCFKLGVIVQQIYARYKKGLTNDPRFASLIYVVKACAFNASSAIKYNRINNFK